MKIKFKNFNESKNKQEKSKKKISTSLKSKEKLIKTIDNILDFQIKTKQRIISFKKDNEKKSNSLEKKEKPYKSDNNLDIPEFLQKTKGRLAEHSKLTIKETMNRKNELNKKKETLEKLKLQAQKEISKIPQKKFDPKQKFNLNLEEITDFQKIENEIFNEIQPENFEIERLDMKENTKNVK